MDDHLPSRTALVTALMRSRHSRLDPRPLIDDRWGERLVPEVVRTAIGDRALATMDDAERKKALSTPDSIADDALRKLPAYAHVVLRSRYAEDALADVAQRGTRQYVLIGAGSDSFALRRPAFAREVEIYEVDHPATQRLKLQRLADCGVALASSVHFISADLVREGLAAALARSPFRADRRAFFSWLGVTTYLTREANRAALRAISGCAAPDSELVFTYLDQRALDAPNPSAEFEAVKAMVASVSEPLVSGFDPATLRQELLACGLQLLEDLDGAQLVDRYDRDGVNGLRSALTSHIAWAKVISG